MWSIWGDLTFKFLQQVCAAMVVGEKLKRLDYSAYGDESLASKLKDLLDKLEKKNKTVADIYQMMIKYNETDKLSTSRTVFRDYVDKWVNAS